MCTTYSALIRSVHIELDTAAMQRSLIGNLFCNPIIQKKYAKNAIRRAREYRLMAEREAARCG